MTILYSGGPRRQLKKSGGVQKTLSAGEQYEATIYMHGTPPLYKKNFKTSQRFSVDLKSGLNLTGGLDTPIPFCGDTTVQL